MGIYVVAAEKGGCGKTTVATNLAIMRATAGRDVLMVDADPQRSASEFFFVRQEEGLLPAVTCVGVTGKGLAAEIRKLQPKYEDIIIDVGGRDSSGLRSALMVAEVLVVPFLPGQYDIWSLESMNDLLEDALPLNPGMKCLAVMNKADTNNKIHLADEALVLVTSCKNLVLLENRLCYRVAYRRSSAEGRAVGELARCDGKALAEMKILYAEVFK